jgi:rhamnosyltransferase
MFPLGGLGRTFSDDGTGNLPAGEYRVAAVIVTYFPDAAFAERMLRVAGQATAVIIVDNSASPDVQHRLRSLTSDKIEILENTKNEGIARALNQGILRAIERRCSWVLTLDQDSVVDDDLVARLVAIHQRCSHPEQVGLIHSNARSKWSGLPALKCSDPYAEFREVKAVVTSGSLIPISAYRVGGPFRDDFFIEGVDLEYCLRLRKAGFHILLSCRPLMVHAAGRMEEHRLGGRTIVVANHAPWRYYYMTRNLLRIIRGYASREPIWALTALLNLGKAVVKDLLFEDRPFTKIVFVLAGTWDAVIGSTRVKFVPGRS